MAPAPSRDCLAARDALSARLDGEEPGLGEDELAAHVARCAACRGFAAAIGPLARRLRLAAAVPEPGLVTVVVQRLEAERRARRRNALLRAAAVALALAAVPVGTIAVSQHPVVHPTHAPSPCTAHLARPRPRRWTERDRSSRALAHAPQLEGRRRK
jgi:predicted anti-sigma-YlaC factor YlaD